MINHISISAHNPEKVANVFAELWNGYVFPFMACPDSFIVLAGDRNGTAIEITRRCVCLLRDYAALSSLVIK